MNRRLLPVLLLAGIAPAFAQPTTVIFDPARTRVDFTLSTLLHTVHGSFRLERGTMTFDPATGIASGELLVDSGTGESGNPSRDHRMRQSILESARFPRIAFLPDRVEGQVARAGLSSLQIHGRFELHGLQHELTLPIQTDFSGTDISATTQFTIPYVAWGLKDPSTFLLRVSNQVSVEIHALGRVTSP